MKVKFISMPPVLNNIPRLANGWTYNPISKMMELYSKGVVMQIHLCTKKYAHDIYEEQEDIIPLNNI